MNTMAIADCIIALIVVFFSMFAMHQGKATRETEMKSALCYLTIAVLLASVLFVAI